MITNRHLICDFLTPCLKKVMSSPWIYIFIMKAAHMHDLHRDILQTPVYMGHWYLSATSIWAHNVAQTLSNTVGFLLLRNTSSFFPSSVRPNERKHSFKLLKQIYSYMSLLIQWLIIQECYLSTLWMLQPVAVDVVQVTTLKLLLAVVWHWHGDEGVHVVKALLIRETQVIETLFFLVLSKSYQGFVFLVRLITGLMWIKFDESQFNRVRVTFIFNLQ